VTARIPAAADTWQRSHAPAAVPVAVPKKFDDDRASSLAALMAYSPFFSLFPLLLVFVSVLGFVLESDPSLQADIIDSTLARIPVVGAQLDDEVAPLTGSALGLAVGLGGALWAGLGVTLALGREVNGVLHSRLWPRSLTGDLEPADREALPSSARAARQDQRQEILVRFDDS
jgi:uncharacterized BrkB/YihY/UPF0761 family membrane protein